MFEFLSMPLEDLDNSQLMALVMLPGLPLEPPSVWTRLQLGLRRQQGSQQGQDAGQGQEFNVSTEESLAPTPQ